MFAQCPFVLDARSNFKGTTNNFIYVKQISAHAFKLLVLIVICAMPQTELLIEERNAVLIAVDRYPMAKSVAAGRFSMLPWMALPQCTN